jgi:TonB family protein
MVVQLPSGGWRQMNYLLKQIIVLNCLLPLVPVAQADEFKNFPPMCLFGRAPTTDELAGEAQFFPWSLACRDRLDRVWRNRHQNYPNADIYLSCKVILAQNGNVQGVEVFKSSGSAEIDKHAIELVMGAAPFLPIPETTKVRTFSFQFPHFPDSSYAAITPARAHDFDASAAIK